MPPQPRAVIRSEPDAYNIGKTWLMGRQVAGHGFLRAYLAAREPGPIDCYAPARKSAEGFTQLAKALDPTVAARWISPTNAARIGEVGGVLYLADPSVPTFAEARLRFGMDRYSLCGVTHTTATSATMRLIADLVSGPVAPWDALICTSSAVLQTVRRIHEAEADYLRWRFGPEVRLSPPQLPVIPLGVHCADFAVSDAQRVEAREQLEIADDEVVALFVGRLTFTGKHHPFVMYQALEAVAQRTGKRLVLILCGWAPNEDIAAAFTDGAAQFAPSVRTVMVEGRDNDLRRQAWGAGDLFLSISDGIQETFGLTPIEAMAAGLPCIVSDWNGYKDTVRDGVDGFRIRSWAPVNGMAGEALAREYEMGENNYDNYLWAAAAATSVDLAQFVDRLADLVEQPDLRRTMGEAGRRRAAEVFDWSVVMRQYHELWGELTARREAGRSDDGVKALLAGAPKASSTALSPFDAFGHYPSELIGPATFLALIDGVTAETYRERRAHVLFVGLRIQDTVAEALIAHLGQGPSRVSEAAEAVGVAAGPALYFAGLLAKMGIVRLGSR
jgi:glycosyltransferase involved in cell wall biosynthesis